LNKDLILFRRHLKMSNGMMADKSSTKAVIDGKISVISKGKTWLRHTEGKQSGMIDLLVLEGIYSTKEMAIKIEKNFPKITDSEKRVKDHIDHLQKGDGRNRASGMKPHFLNINIDAAGKVRFNTAN
jgi:hypothetical protein